MTNHAVGHRAEEYAANYLAENGHEILALNWKTARCEIDIITQKNQVIYFVEAKYRQNDSYGQGLDYITASKMRQMSYAAETWVHWQNYSGEYCLAAIELTGPNFEVTNFVTDI